MEERRELYEKFPINIYFDDKIRFIWGYCDNLKFHEICSIFMKSESCLFFFIALKFKIDLCIRLNSWWFVPECSLRLLCNKRCTIRTASFACETHFWNDFESFFDAMTFVSRDAAFILAFDFDATRNSKLDSANCLQSSSNSWKYIASIILKKMKLHCE